MVRIKINSNAQTDVTDMRAKGWHALVFRGTPAQSNEDFVTVEKKDIRFVARITMHEDTKCVEVLKYLDGYLKDVKQFYENGCGINGTLCISEGKSADLTYAFFRNEKLQKIIDEFGLRRIVFPRDPGDKFEKDVQIDLARYQQYTGNKHYPIAPSFHTDGTYEEIKPDDRNIKRWHVANASYILEFNTMTLTIPQKYDTDKIWEILKDLV